MVKIAFGYKRRVGKDTACNYLIQKYGGIKLSFAKPLYDILNFAQGVCNFEKIKDRKFLQFIGTEWARTINNDVWVDLLIDKLKVSQTSVQTSVQNIFVSDLRFHNEFKALKDHGFICIQLESNIQDNLDGYTNHQSDVDLDNFDGWDYTIKNIGNKEDFYAQLDQLFEKLSI